MLELCRDRGGRGFSNYEPARDRERDGGRYGGFSRGDNDRGGYREREREREAPKERPRLNLAPRSKPVEEGEESSAHEHDGHDDRRADGSDGRDGEDGAKEVDAALKSLSVSKDRGRIVAESRLKL